MLQCACTAVCCRAWQSITAIPTAEDSTSWRCWYCCTHRIRIIYRHLQCEKTTYILDRECTETRECMEFGKVCCTIRTCVTRQLLPFPRLKIGPIDSNAPRVCTFLQPDRVKEIRLKNSRYVPTTTDGLKVEPTCSGHPWLVTAHVTLLAIGVRFPHC